MSTTHTPGPWFVQDQRDMTPDEPFWIVVEHPEYGQLSIAAVRAGCEEAEELGDLRATATVMAAAPELLAVLQEAWDSPTNTEGSEWWGRVLAAMTKATGFKP